MSLARRIGLPSLLALSLAATVVNPDSIAAQRTQRGSPERALVELVLGIAGPPAAALERLTGAQALSTGSDGRITVLLLGSDSRAAGISRTDTILIASLKGKSISMASIPRDTARIPNPFAGGTFRGKVNGIIRSLMLSGDTRDQALRKFELVIENLLRIEIDYHAVVWFGGLTTLVGQVDPITVTIPREIRDPTQVDAPGDRWGVYFPRANSYSLYDYNRSAPQLCTGDYKSDLDPPVDPRFWCHRALPFVRTRKGPGNNDWIRARRQQDFIFAVIKAVGSGELSGLYNTGRSQGGGKWLTNMPLTLANVQDLYNRLQGATFTQQVVFKPTAYATGIAGTSGYQLKLAEVRSWTATYMR